MRVDAGRPPAAVLLGLSALDVRRPEVDRPPAPGGVARADHVPEHALTSSACRRRCPRSRGRRGSGEHVVRAARPVAATGSGIVAAPSRTSPMGPSASCRSANSGSASTTSAGTFYAIANRCPHEGGPLCEGRQGGRTVVDDDAPGRATLVRRGRVGLLPLAPVGHRTRNRDDGGQAGVERPHLPRRGSRRQRDRSVVKRKARRPPESAPRRHH